MVEPMDKYWSIRKLLFWSKYKIRYFDQKYLYTFHEWCFLICFAKFNILIRMIDRKYIIRVAAYKGKERRKQEGRKNKWSRCKEKRLVWSSKNIQYLKDVHTYTCSHTYIPEFVTYSNRVSLKSTKLFQIRLF